MSLPFAEAAPPQVVVCDVEFPDGTRATYTRTLYAFNPEEAQASLSSLPVIPEPGVDALAALRGAGFAVRTVEETEPDVTFVTPEYVLQPMVGLAAKAERWPPPASSGRRLRRIRESSRRLSRRVPERERDSAPKARRRRARGTAPISIFTLCRRRGGRGIHARRQSPGSGGRADSRRLRSPQHQQLYGGAGPRVPGRGHGSAGGLACGRREGAGVAGRAAHRRPPFPARGARRPARLARSPTDGLARGLARHAPPRPLAGSGSRSRGARFSPRDAESISAGRGIGRITAADALRRTGWRAGARAGDVFGWLAHLRRHARRRLPQASRRHVVGTCLERPEDRPGALARDRAGRSGDGRGGHRRGSFRQRRGRRPLAEGDGRARLGGDRLRRIRPVQTPRPLRRLRRPRSLPQRRRRPDAAPDRDGSRRFPSARRGSDAAFPSGGFRERHLPKRGPRPDVDRGGQASGPGPGSVHRRRVGAENPRRHRRRRAVRQCRLGGHVVEERPRPDSADERARRSGRPGPCRRRIAGGRLRVRGRGRDVEARPGRARGSGCV